MRLRDLEPRDAERMLAWMHDPFVVEKLQANFLEKTAADCRAFIAASHADGNLHLAIADDADVYMGTASLKHIAAGAAEFAIVVCREAMGKGYAIGAMREILALGFGRYGLTTIYWRVAPDNARALRFYDKNGFSRTAAAPLAPPPGYTAEQAQAYVWYQVARPTPPSGTRGERGA